MGTARFLLRAPGDGPVRPGPAPILLVLLLESPGLLPVCPAVPEPVANGRPSGNPTRTVGGSNVGEVGSLPRADAGPRRVRECSFRPERHGPAGPRKDPGAIPGGRCLLPAVGDGTGRENNFQRHVRLGCSMALRHALSAVHVLEGTSDPGSPGAECHPAAASPAAARHLDPATVRRALPAASAIASRCPAGSAGLGACRQAFAVLIRPSYIRSGAETPRRARPFLTSWRTAATMASRARLRSRSPEITRSSLSL